MADDAPAPASGAPPIDYNAIIQQIMQGSGPVTGPAAPATPAVNPNLPITSLLGEAFGGGVSPLYPMSEAQQTQAGNAALLNFGIGMLQNASGPVRHSLGQAVASGLLGAQGSLAGVREGQAQMLDLQNKQQQMGLEKIKTILPLLQLQAQMKISSGSNPLAGNAPGGGIGATGAPITTIARDPSIPTVGQQANNSGNLMVPQGGSLPTGSIGVVPASGGRMVAAFPDASTGIAAQSDNLAGYANAGVNTIRGAVNRWVGDPKANTDSYVADIAKAAGVDPDAKIDLTNPAIQRAFFMAQQPHESGKPWLSQADVDKGIALAAARRTAPPGAAKTATAPPATTTASAVSTAPPGVQMGGAPPAPPGGSAGPYAGGGFGAALAPGGAANPVAVRGTPIPAGKVVGAIQQGMQTAAATPARDTTLAAGPAARAPTAAPSTPWPATTTTIGNYNDTPATAPPTVTPPAQPTPQVTTQAQQPDTRPDVELTPEQYVLRHFVPATDADRQTFTVPVNPASVQAAQLAVEGAQRAQAAAAQDRQNAITPEARATAGQNYTKATEALQTANATLADIQGKADTATSTAAAKFAEDQRARLTTTYNQMVHDKTVGDQAIALKKLEGQQAIQQAGVTSDVQAGQKVLEAVNGTREGAQDTVNNVEIAKNFSKLAGTSGFLQQWPQVSNFLIRNNLLTSDEVQQYGAQKGLDAVMNKVILSMRAGSGMSRTTNFDLQFLQNAAPSSFTPEQMRPAMFAAIQSAAARQVQYVDRVNELHASGMPAWQARQQADEDLGHIVKETPTVFPKDDPRAGQPMSADDQNKWIIRNVTPGTFYTQPNGALAIRGEPKQAQQ